MTRDTRKVRCDCDPGFEKNEIKGGGKLVECGVAFSKDNAHPNVGFPVEGDLMMAIEGKRPV
jgi:hypothetical protein